MEQIMSINSLLSALIFVLLGLAIKFVKSRRQIRNLPPSPNFGLPILGHLHLIKEPLHRSLFHLSQKHGPIFSLRLGSRFAVVVSSPSAVQECFTKNDVVLADRPQFIMGKYVNYNNSTLPATCYGDHWRNLRRLATIEIFSSHRLNLSSDIRRDEVNRLLRKLYRASANGGFAKVELKSMFSELTFNNVTRMVTGKRYLGDDADNSGEGRRFPYIIKELFEMAVNSYPGDFLPLFKWFDCSGYIKKIRSLGNEEDELIQGMIDQHKRNKGDAKIENTMISHLLSLQESDPGYYTDVIIKGMIQVILNGGFDTTAVTLEWAMCNLLNHPHALEKARAELEENVGQTRLVEDSDISKLPYLQNIISETLRLQPAAPLLVPHEASDHCNIGGYDIPKGTILMVNAWALQRDPTLWENPTSFKPERFESKEVSDESYKLLPFGLGRRACPGMALAQRVLGLTLGSLIQCFEWKKVSEEEIDMTEGRGLTMPKVIPLEAMCKPTDLGNKVLSKVV